MILLNYIHKTTHPLNRVKKKINFFTEADIIVYGNRYKKFVFIYGLLCEIGEGDFVLLVIC